MSEPRTDAGRALLAEYAEDDAAFCPPAPYEIAEIEDEARASLLADLRAKVEALPQHDMDGSRFLAREDMRRAVLDFLR